MVPESGHRREFRDYIVYAPFEGDLYNVQGWKHTGLWRVIRVTQQHCFFEKFAGSKTTGCRKKLLLTSWRQFIRDGRVEKFTKHSPALTGFQEACANWLGLKEDGEIKQVPPGADKSYLAGLMMGAVLIAEGIPKSDT
jgi:hypothetical protein